MKKPKKQKEHNFGEPELICLRCLTEIPNGTKVSYYRTGGHMASFFREPCNTCHKVARTVKIKRVID
jgi:hypothetical protein